MASLLFFALVFLALISGLIVLQVFLCKLENKFLGLILPILAFILSLVGTLTLCLAVGTSLLSIFLWLLLGNIPTIIFMGIYLAHRGKKKKSPQNQLNRMNIQDLD